MAFFRDRAFLHASAVLTGTMIGVGIYAIPFAFAKAGFWVGTVWLVLLAYLSCLIHLSFGELTLSTQGTHQLVGYATTWLGIWGRRIMGFAHILAATGALLAYIIIFGDFCSHVLSNFIIISPQQCSILFALFFAFLWLARLRTIATVEIGLIIGYLAVVLLIGVGSAPYVKLANYLGSVPDFWFLPYGIFLFALSGTSAVPIQRQLLQGRERLLRPAIIIAIVFSTSLYLLFAAVVVGVSGEVTSPEALAGLSGLVPPIILLLGSLLGVFTISTSYIALGTALYETYSIDYGISPRWAWFLTGAPPIILFWFGLRNFIDVIGLIGAVAGGLIGVVLLAAYLRARKAHMRMPEFRVPLPSWAVGVLMAALAAGSIYEIILR